MPARRYSPAMRRPRFFPRCLAVAAALWLAPLFLGGCAEKTVSPPPAPPGAAAFGRPAPAPTPVTTPWPTRITPASQQIQSFSSLAPAVDRSIAYVSRKPPTGIAVDHPGARLTWGQLHQALVTFRRILPELDRDPSILAKYFKWVPLETDTLLTGYYQPLLEVSRTPSATYAWPIYRNPGSQRIRQHDQ